MRIMTAGLVACCFLAAPATAAEFASSYNVEGSSPEGGGDYSGTVNVKKTGAATYQVVWNIGKDKFVGTGIGGPDGLAVAYRSGDNTGVAIYREAKGGEIEGYWTYAGGTKIGEEKWAPR